VGTFGDPGLAGAVQPVVLAANEPLTTPSRVVVPTTLVLSIVPVPGLPAQFVSVIVPPEARPLREHGGSPAPGVIATPDKAPVDPTERFKAPGPSGTTSKLPQ